MTLSDEKYVLLTTFKRDGTPVATPVWWVPMEGERFGFYTSSTSGKIKRLDHTERVTVQPCNARGKVREGTSPTEATARAVTGPELGSITSKVREKYGFATKVTKALARIGGLIKRRHQPYADRGVVVTPTSGGSANPST
jgi:PPOX class probable F420-dependent enzyme